MSTPNDTRTPSPRKLSSEELARFIEVNHYDPTTKEGLIEHVDQVMIELGRAVDKMLSWQKPPSGMTYEQAKPDIQKDQDAMNRWKDYLIQAQAQLGEFVYNEAKRVKR